MSHASSYFRKIIGRTFQDELKILKMDVDENPETACFRHYVHSNLGFKKDGQVVKQVAGVHTAAQIKAIVAELRLKT